MTSSPPAPTWDCQQLLGVPQHRLCGPGEHGAHSQVLQLAPGGNRRHERAGKKHDRSEAIVSDGRQRREGRHAIPLLSVPWKGAKGSEQRAHSLCRERLHLVKEAQLDPAAVGKQDGLRAALLAGASVGVLVALREEKPEQKGGGGGGQRGKVTCELSIALLLAQRKVPSHPPPSLTVSSPPL